MDLEVCRSMIDGFDTPPMFMMGHDQPYTATRIEALLQLPAG